MHLHDLEVVYFENGKYLMKKSIKFISLFLTIITLSFSTLGNVTKVYAAEKIQATYQYTQEDIDSLTPILDAIEQVPDDLLLNGNSGQINQYFRSKGIHLKVYNDLLGETTNAVPIRTPLANYWRCGLAIGQLLVTVAIPASQLTKIKKYISALGGVWNAAQLLVGATSASEKLQGTVAALSGILFTLTGISDIKDYCFG